MPWLRCRARGNSESKTYLAPVNPHRDGVLRIRRLRAVLPVRESLVAPPSPATDPITRSSQLADSRPHRAHRSEVHEINRGTTKRARGSGSGRHSPHEADLTEDVAARRTRYRVQKNFAADRTLEAEQVLRVLWTLCGEVAARKGKEPRSPWASRSYDRSGFRHLLKASPAHDQETHGLSTAVAPDRLFVNTEVRDLYLLQAFKPGCLAFCGLIASWHR
mmetsp:Transcript_61641/g.133477  ORF Transcript_61641/g.133477 Transcript_61641/m.133477 type:complete len:219 (+) Transcript_61641:600-1256(+)